MGLTVMLRFIKRSWCVDEPSVMLMFIKRSGCVDGPSVMLMLIKRSGWVDGAHSYSDGPAKIRMGI